MVSVLTLRKFRTSVRDDWDKLYKLYELHDLPRMPHNWFSNYGLIVERDDELIAAGFLYFTNSSRATLEDIITDPTKFSLDRFQAIQMIIKEAIEVSYTQGFNYLVGYTREQCMVKHGENLGCRLIKQPFYCLTVGV